MYIRAKKIQVTSSRLLLKPLILPRKHSWLPLLPEIQSQLFDSNNMNVNLFPNLNKLFISSETKPQASLSQMNGLVLLPNE